MSKSSKLDISMPVGEMRHVETLLKDLDNLHQDNSRSDVILIVGQEPFHAHKAILAARSEYFRALLFGGLKESNQPQVELKETSPQAFKLILKYIYTGSIILTGQKEDVILNVLALARMYDFTELKAAVSSHVIRILNVDNVLMMYDVAEELQLSPIREACRIYIGQNASTILERKEFLSLSATMLSGLINGDAFIAKEIDIFLAILKWNKNNPDSELKQLLSAIRLPLISIFDLVQIVRPTQLFSSSAILNAIEEAIDKNVTDLPYRGGFLNPEENVATISHGATVVHGGGGTTLLHNDTCNNKKGESGFASHPISKLDQSHCILVKLGNTCIINHIKLLLWENDLGDNWSYSYYVEVSGTTEDWHLVVDHTKQLCRSWQTLHFPSRPVRLIRITGTQNTEGGEFRVVAMECMFTKIQYQLDQGLIGKMRPFRTGATNLMVATQVVEEGLDIPKCNAVIRFDPPKNFTSYVQSMGRARAEKALYVLLVDPVEKGQLVNDITVYKMVECILNVESHNRSLPTEEDFDGFLEDYHVLEPYYPTNREGAAVSINTAMETLNRYCNNLPHDRYTQLGPKFRYMKKPADITKICCSITLPFGALGFTREPIVGKFMTDKKLARKAAAFEACVRLHREGELNDNLMPARNYIERYDEQLGIIPMEDFPKSTPTPGTKKRRQVYDKQVADDLSHAFPNSGESSYLYAICFDAEECDETIGNQPCYGILTSKPIRNVCAFTLYGKATSYMVRLRCLTENFKIDQANLSSLEEFHCFLFRDVLHLATEAMEYCPQDVKFSLLIVPLTVTPSRNAFIDWELVIRCQEYENAMHTDDDDCTDCPSKGDVVVPQYGESSLRGRRFYVLRVCHELTPQTPFSKYSSFEHYMRLKYETQLTNLEQPLLLVDYIPNTLNVLHPQLVRDSATNLRRQQHQIPELCKIYPMNIHSVSQAFFVPSTLHRLNGLLLAQQLRDRVIVEANLPLQIGVSPEPLPLLEALCTACRITEDTIFSPYGFLGDTDPTLLGALIFQALTTSSADNWSDLERLEVVGDSFLKFAISVFLFCTIGSLNEGGLSTLRTGLVKNFNLYSHAKDKEIPGLLNASMFQPRLMWLSPGFRFPEGLRQALLAAGVQRHLWPHAVPTDTRSFANDDEGWVAELMRRWADTNPAQRESVQINAGQTPCPPFNDSFEDDDGEPASPDGACDYYTQQLMGDKTVADAAEAIIGAVLLFCGQDAALCFISWLGLKVQPDTYPWTPPKSALVMALPQEKLDEIYVGQDDLERQLGYTFKEKSFLRQALIHPSYMREPVTDNYQRLEFLGDAILDFLVTMNLYKMHPDLSPGDMTDLRSSLVNNVTFGYLTVKNELHKHLKYSSHNLFQVIDRYIKHIDTMEHPKDVVYLINEDETVELEEVEIPKALGDVFEAIAGAIFIDSGLSLEAVWKVYYPMMKDVMDKYSTQLPINPIRFLLEKFPQTIFGKPVNHDGSYTVEVICNGQRFTGLSRNKTFAKQAAAKSALRAFNILSTRSMS